MLRTVAIDNVFGGLFGRKIGFKLPSDVNVVKSFLIKIDGYEKLIRDYQDFISFFVPHSTSYFFLYKYSLALNNGNDECIVDAVGTSHNLTNNPCFAKKPQTPPSIKFGELYIHNREKVIINQTVIKNAVHFITFKMPESLIKESERDSNHRNYMEYIAQNLKLKLILETE